VKDAPIPGTTRFTVLPGPKGRFIFFFVEHAEVVGLDHGMVASIQCQHRQSCHWAPDRIPAIRALEEFTHGTRKQDGHQGAA
jgi:hypothetical protein